MTIGYSADELFDLLRHEFNRTTSKELAMSREEREILLRLIQRTALQVATKAIELNNQRVAEQLAKSITI